MSKWADYGIHAVKYDQDKDHIEKVKVRKDLGEKIEGKSQEWSRTKVVSEIEDGTTFVTIFKKDNDNWEKGQEVHPVKVGGQKYIRTDRNATASDNLENLPEYS